MGSYEYRCVNAPVGIVVRKESDRNQAVKAYEDIINQEAAAGWEYVGMDSYTTDIKPGCFTLAPDKTQVTHRMLVFKRPA